MPKYISQQARVMSDWRVTIAGSINANLINASVPILQEVVNGVMDAINEIEAMLRRENVRVREHSRLGIPALPQDPKIRKMLKRFENTIHVLCTLADIVAGGQGPAVTQEETQSVGDSQGILELLKDNVQEAFSRPSSESEFE